MHPRLKEELDNFLIRLNAEPSVSKNRSMCLEFIESLCENGKLLDPRNPATNDSVFGFYGLLAKDLSNRGLDEIAFQILQKTWQTYQRIQTEVKQEPIYKASIAAVISDMFVRRGDLSAAARWGLITDASDVLYNGNRDGGGRQRLIVSTGIPDEALDKLRTIALANRNLVVGVPDWSIPEAFAEDIVTKFLAEHQQYSVFFARNSSTVHEFPISKEYFSSRLRVVRDANDNLEKGNTLEDLASYLTTLIPGWIPRRNVKTVYNEFESDIIVSNLIREGNLDAEMFGRSFLIECKNWSKPVGVAEVGYFLYRMRLTHTTFGMLFARNGITGGKDNDTDRKKVRNTADSLVQRAFNEDGYICIVITEADLEELSQGESFWAMIVEKARTVQFGKSIYKAN